MRLFLIIIIVKLIKNNLIYYKLDFIFKALEDYKLGDLLSKSNVIMKIFFIYFSLIKKYYLINKTLPLCCNIPDMTSSTKNLGINFYTSEKINIDYIGTFTKDKQDYDQLLKTKENNPSTYISFQYADNLNQKIMLYKDILNVLEKNMEYKIPLDSKGYFIETKNNDEVLCIISIKKDDLNDLNIASMNKGETEIYYGKQHHDGKVYGEGSVWNDGKMIFQGFINDNSYEKQFGIKLLDNEEEKEEENNDYFICYFIFIFKFIFH